MRRASLVVLVSLASAACAAGGTTKDFESPVSACQSFASASCIRLSQCQSGVDVNNCTTQLENVEGCNMASCGAGTFSPTAAQQCYNDWLNQTCADALSNMTPASCNPNNICPIS